MDYFNKAQNVQQVDGERIYQQILRIEGTEHPIDSPEKLEDASDYICSEFEDYGLDSQRARVQG